MAAARRLSKGPLLGSAEAILGTLALAGDIFLSIS